MCAAVPLQSGAVQLPSRSANQLTVHPSPSPLTPPPCCAPPPSTHTPLTPPELEGAGIHKMKMLQKMRLLEEKGTTFASTPIKELKVFGESTPL